MAINKKLIHFKTLADFEQRLASNEILDTSIVYIQDAKMIWTHGTYYADLSKEKADELYQPKGDYKLQKILSQSEYDQIDIKDEDTVYVITDDDTGTVNKIIFEAQTDPIDAMSGELSIDGGDSDDNSIDTLNGGISTGMDIALDITAKQDALISGKNIKTINNQSLLGSGNIEITQDLSDYITIEQANIKYQEKGQYATSNELNQVTNSLDTLSQTIVNKQDVLTSGTNIKTINGQSVLGEGNIEITSELPENIATLEDISNAVTPIENELYIESGSTFSGAWDTTKQTGYVGDIPDVWNRTFDFIVNGEGTVELYAADSPDTPSFNDDKICDLETGQFYVYYVNTKKVFKYGVQDQLEEIATVNTGYTQLYFKGNSGSGTYNINNVNPAVKAFNLYTKQQVDSLLLNKQNLLVGGTGIDIEGNVISSTITNVSELTNDSGYQTSSQVNTAINNRLPKVENIEGTIDVIPQNATFMTLVDAANEDIVFEYDESVGYIRGYIKDFKASELVKIGRPIVNTNSSTVSMWPNIYYRVTNTPSTLTLTFNTKLTTNMEEYFIEFTTSSDGCSLIVPSSVKWMNGEVPALEANSTYQISIVNNLAICAVFK